MRNNILFDSTICTDDNPSYMGVLRWRQTVNYSAKQHINGIAYTNDIEIAGAMLKRGYNDIHHNFSPKHLAKYIDKFIFRLNDGNAGSHTLERIDSLCDCAVKYRITYEQIVS